MLRTDALEYDLPEELIATRAVEPRDSARLLVVSRTDEGRLEHRRVRDVPEFLDPGDVMVFNQSRVIRARIRGVRDDTGGAIEGLFLERAKTPLGAWKMLLRSNGRLREGLVVRLIDSTGQQTEQTLRLVEKADDSWIVTPAPPVPDPTEFLERLGLTPLPPYILQARKAHGEIVADDVDRIRYQTVYATGAGASGAGGSVAAPTAGLHFTDELLTRLDHRGVVCSHVDLQVGWGTFKPVQTERVEDHPMHEELCYAPPETIARIAAPDRGRVFAVGTTSARTLESVPAPLGQWRDSGWSGATRLLITPGYRWSVVDGMVTNFHLPRSTLLAMVGALFPGGVERLLEIYRVAIADGYRFYSYGDAMLILP